MNAHTPTPAPTPANRSKRLTRRGVDLSKKWHVTGKGWRRQKRHPVAGVVLYPRGATNLHVPPIQSPQRGLKTSYPGAEPQTVSSCQVETEAQTSKLMWQGRARWALGLPQRPAVSKYIFFFVDNHTKIARGRKSEGGSAPHLLSAPLDIILLIKRDHTPGVFRAWWAFIRSASARGKYCTWLAKYSFRVLMSDSCSIYVWGNYYICLAAQITHECSHFHKTCDALVKHNRGKQWQHTAFPLYFGDGKNE